MTPQQAYLAMYSFLETYFERGASDDLAALLGSMALLSDGRPADSAIASDWENAVRQALSGQVNASQTLRR